ncbi:Cellulose synthase catalytic subunit [UDP-forming] [Labrenzia sp. THAF82]|uniref:glycosyltransferase family 2 protein n=1 Tax=Labrenzia sp. THAF82 TaxID=2587861 RepID=UPI0012A9EFAB|nr:glycosyltransferase family 2 protein [Labrenzia sp. THAF82]QFT29405.1 Cellulose synthase catalytic subunit [UDP-forming] [Labrenzia sp. THAF82]
MQAESLVPLLLITAAILLFGNRCQNNAWAERLVVAGLTVVILRYLNWRLVETVLPVGIFSVTGLFIWTVFIIEILVWLDTALLYAYMLRRTNRTPEADKHETRLRGTTPLDLPEVDIFIATYNEPAEVLEKTIFGAMELDWPQAKLNVWVLDDGRRGWLQRMSKRLGVGYLTRADNAHAKAGNINAAVPLTSAPFFLVLDADFIPQRDFLYRAMGFFEDPKIGIVQIPHNFFNPDPMQASLNLSKVMPDDQRFFFETIMPGRDGYDCAFCCGSNGIVRRSALEEIGNKLPCSSITEDMLLTLALKRKGYITRYLDERLAFGLAPENINAFFIQRARWARGAIQIMFLREGPFGGPGLKWYERLFFLPLHWITQSFGATFAMVTPVIFLLTGMPPLVNASTDTVMSFQLPAVVAAIAAVRHFAPGKYHPLARMALNVLQAFRLLPVVAVTLLKPHGHAFKVTPKGSEGTEIQDTATVAICLMLCGLMTAGLVINSSFNLQIVASSHLMSVVALWLAVNMVVLLLVAKIAITPQSLRSEVRFELNEPVVLRTEGGEQVVGKCHDISLNGIQVEVHACCSCLPEPGGWIGVDVAQVGVVPALLQRVFEGEGGSLRAGLSFVLPAAEELAEPLEETSPECTAEAEDVAQLRRRLILKLFTKDRVRKFDGQDDWRIGVSMLKSIVASEKVANSDKNVSQDAAHPVVPDWLAEMVASFRTSFPPG